MLVTLVMLMLQACEVLSSVERDGADSVSIWLPNCVTDNCISQGRKLFIIHCIRENYRNVFVVSLKC